MSDPVLPCTEEKREERKEWPDVIMSNVTAAKKQISAYNVKTKILRRKKQKQQVCFNASMFQCNSSPSAYT